MLRQNREEKRNPAANNTPTVSQQVENRELNPYSIEALRQRSYSGGALTLERELGDQGNFTLFVMSYMSEGFKQYTLMSVPEGVKPEGGYPVIILNHGYIEPTVYSTTSSYRSYFDAYARQGFIVLKPDYRGHDNSEGEPISAHTSPDYVIDVLNLVEAAKIYGDVNPNKIGMWGHSMGGGITLRAMAISKDIKAAALLAGVVASPDSFYAYWTLLRDDPRVPSWIKENAQRTLDEFGAPESNPDLWQSISPYTYISEMNMPVQIHHGTADPDVPILFSEELNNALRNAGKNVEYFVYQGGDHNLAGAARSPVLSRTIQLFKGM
ncbi:MAG TPA: alpha/beta fold hydrolase [Candidatus Binatia bacterium]|nr:alpha/beta fold hydrolase [Candidatus Binatia bacterium]